MLIIYMLVYVFYLWIALILETGAADTETPVGSVVLWREVRIKLFLSLY